MFHVSKTALSTSVSVLALVLWSSAALAEGEDAGTGDSDLENMPQVIDDSGAAVDDIATGDAATDDQATDDQGGDDQGGDDQASDDQGADGGLEDMPQVIDDTGAVPDDGSATDDGAVPDAGDDTDGALLDLPPVEDPQILYMTGGQGDSRGGTDHSEVERTVTEPVAHSGAGNGRSSTPVFDQCGFGGAGLGGLCGKTNQ